MVSSADGGGTSATPSWGRRVLITLVAVLVSSLLGVVGGVALVAGRGGDGPTPSPSPPTSGPTAPTTTASTVVREYLDALARGDAAAALASAATQPADTSLLTDEVLAASRALAPITEVNVPEVGDRTTVEATYRIGGERITDTFSVTEVEGGGFLLDEVVSELDVSRLRSDRLPLRFGGVEVTGDTLTLFPGSYAVETGNPYLSYGDGVLLVSVPGRVLSSSELAPALTEQGVSAFASLVEDALDECLTETSPVPSGCPYEASLNSSHDVEGDRGRWVVEDDPMEDFEPRLDSSDPTRATAFLSGQLLFRYSYTSEYEEGEQDGEVSVGLSTTAAVDLAADPLRVTFE